MSRAVPVEGQAICACCASPAGDQGAEFCPECGAPFGTHPSSGLQALHAVVALFVLGSAFFISIMMYPVAAVGLLVTGVLALTAGTRRRWAALPLVWLHLPWISSGSSTAGGIILCVWAVGTTGVGYGAYASSHEMHVQDQHATATAIARAHATSTAIVNAHAAATVAAHLMATAQVKASATALVRAQATATAAVHARQTVTVRAHVQALAQQTQTVRVAASHAAAMASAQATAQARAAARTAAAQQTAQAKAAMTLTVHASVDPASMPYDDEPTVNATTLPGATCTADVVYSTGRSPVSFGGGEETAGSDGTVSWTWHEETKGDGGTAPVSCSYQGQSTSDTAFFTVTG